MEVEEEKIGLSDLPTNLISVIYQFLPEKDMCEASRSAKKFYEAMQKDFLMEQLAKKNQMFIPEDENRGETWKEVFEFLRQYKSAEKSGRPSKYKMNPYRGHPTPIEAVCALENNYNFDSTIVSGDDSGNVFTWNLEVDEDDEDEKIMVKDLIMKADSKIMGIKKINGDENIIIWTEKNKFYIYNVNLFKSPKFDKNSKRFELKCEFDIDKDDKIEQIYYDKGSDKIFMSADLRGPYDNLIAYAFNLKTLTKEIYNFGYDNIQSDFIRKDETGQQAQPQGNNHLNPFLSLISVGNSGTTSLDKNHVNNLAVCGDKIILFINYEPVKKQLIRNYTCRKMLPNVFFIDQETKLYKSLHIDLEFIFDIKKISEDKVGFIGLNKSNFLSIKIYSSENMVLLGESVLYSDNTDSIKQFNLLYSGLPLRQEFYYLINNKKLYKTNLSSLKQIKTQQISHALKKVDNITCIESDRHRIVMSSDDLYISIFDITNGEFWYNFLGGSLSVFPKSFVKHPLHNGFHIVKITRNAIIGVMGNLIREYKFVFKKK